MCYQRGIRHFNEREFYDAHEVWEDVWRESSGLGKKFLQGLIQAAVALLITRPGIWWEHAH